MVTEELQIDGMTCGHCTSTVQGALSSVAGVSTAIVDLMSRRAVVTFEPSLTNLEQLTAAVAMAGYTASQAGAKA